LFENKEAFTFFFGCYCIGQFDLRSKSIGAYAEKWKDEHKEEDIRARKEIKSVDAWSSK